MEKDICIESSWGAFRVERKRNLEGNKTASTILHKPVRQP